MAIRYSRLWRSLIDRKSLKFHKNIPLSGDSCESGMFYRSYVIRF